MVKFGNYFQTHLNIEWKEHYINYIHLKSKIKELKKILEKDISNYNSDEGEKDKNKQDYERRKSSIQDYNFNYKYENNQINQDIANLKISIKKNPDYSNLNKNKNIPKYQIYEQQVIEKDRVKVKNYKDKMKEDVLLTRKCINISNYVHDFLSSVDQEIKKFFKFYKNLESQLKSQLNSILARETSIYNLSLFQISDEMMCLDKISKLTLEICYFININITAVRKILKKFDKSFGLSKNPVAIHYLKEMFQKDESESLQYILKFKIIDESSALIEKICKDLKCAMDNRVNKSQQKADNDEPFKEPLLFKNLDIDIEKLSELKLEGVIKTFNKKFAKLKKKIEKIDDANNLLRTSVEVWTLMMKSNMRIVDDLESPNVMHLKHKHEAEEGLLEKLTPQVNHDEEAKLSPAAQKNVWITFIHTFFYMMNCYIIQPTNALYVTYLGASPMVSGLIMGMTPFAAIFCTFFYSKWTNTCYKQPLLFSCFCFIFGNILYTLADYIQSLFVMGLGRFFIGLASARVVNRRYLIEKVPHQLILSYSLRYVIFTCMGMAGGPFFAVWVLHFPEYDYWFFKFNKFTNPGWFCAVIWLTFMSYIYVNFTDSVELLDIDTHSDEKNSRDIDNTDKAFHNEKNNNNNINNNTNFNVRSKNFNEQNSNNMNAVSTNITNNDGNLAANNENELNTNTHSKSSKSNNGEKPNSISSNLIEYDIQNLIREQENTFSYMSISFLLLVIILLVIRMTTESLLVLTPIFMPAEFGLSSLSVSIFLFLTSFIVFPISYLINNVSKSYPERKLMLILLICCSISCFFLIDIPLFMNTTLLKFILFYSVLFVSCNILESVDSALLAKIFPANLNLGVCNSGFTIIMSTTGGRFIGSIIITIIGLLIRHDLVFDFLISFYLISFGLISYFVYRNYSDLRVKAIARIIQKKQL